MPSLLFTPSQVATQLGVSASTVRRLYDSFITSEDSPRSKSSRRLSAQDIEVIREVIRLKAEGVENEAIREQLKNLVFSPALPASPQQGQESPPPAQTALAVVSAVQSALAPYLARLEALEQGQREADAQRLRVDVAWLVVGAFIAGLIVGLSVWWF